MLKLSTFSYIFIVCNFMYNSKPICVLISSVGCYIFLPSCSQVSQMVLVATLASQLQPHGLFTHPQDSQLPLEAPAQVLLPIMWLNIGLSLSFYGMLYHVVSLIQKSNWTFNLWFPNSIGIIRCRTIFYCVSLCKLGYCKENLILLHLIIFQEIKIHSLMHMKITSWIGI